MQNFIIFQSTITCPVCGHKADESMSADACRFFYECNICKSILKPQGSRLLRFLQLWQRSVSSNSTK